MSDSFDLAQRSLDLRAEFAALPLGLDALFSALIEASTPEQELSVSEWADRYRKISAESGSPWPGDWRTDRFPHVREPMDCLHPDHPARSVSLKFAAQTAKSEIGICWFGFIVDRAPAPMLTVLPTGDEAAKYNRVKLQPSIDASPRIRHRVRPENSRDEAASTTAFKRFSGGFDQITTATSSKGLQMISVRFLILDEVSGYPRDTDGRGSPIDQARARQKAYGDMGKELAVSTPGLVGDCAISDMFDAGDRRRRYVPCPICGTFQVLRYDNMQPPSPSTRDRVTFGCIANGCLIDQSDRDEMLAAGRWVPTWVEDGEPPISDQIAAAEIDAYAIAPCEGRVRRRQPSYALWSAYSPAESWGDIWRRGEEADGDPLKEKPFTQQDLGEAYEAASDTPDWEKLLAVRTAWPRGIVPYPACVLTGFIDVQGNRFEWGVWAFGPGFQGWLVERGVIAGGAESSEAWAQIDALTARTWLSPEVKPLDVMRWGIDTGAYTQLLYDKVSARYALTACKSDNRPRAAPFKMTRADLRGANGRPIAGRRIDLALLGAFDVKMSVYEGLRHLVAGPAPDGRWPQGTIHLPDWIGEDEMKQLTAETLVDRRLETNGKGKRKLLVKPGDAREWVKRPHQPNEGLDIAMGCRALAWGEGAGQLSADRWLELTAEAHRVAPRQATLFDAAPIVAPTPSPSPPPKVPDGPSPYDFD